LVIAASPEKLSERGGRNPVPDLDPLSPFQGVEARLPAKMGAFQSFHSPEMISPSLAEATGL
jgi:hypothetical protein